MDMQKRQKQWQWVIGLIIVTICGLVAVKSAQAVITSCSQGSLPQLMIVDFTQSTSIRKDFLDNKGGGPSSWTLIARAWNTGTSNVSYQMTVSLSNTTCKAGPSSLSKNAIGTKNCKIQPEYTPTGRYTLIATASGPSNLQWKYEVCQNP